MQRICENAQAYYDLLVRTARSGGFPAIVYFKGGNFSCCYRTPDGKKCAVGIILPDELYMVEMENCHPKALVDRLGAAWVPDGISVEDMFAIQEIHDCNCWVGTECSADRFIDLINELACFASVEQVAGQPA